MSGPGPRSLRRKEAERLSPVSPVSPVSPATISEHRCCRVGQMSGDSDPALCLDSPGHAIFIRETPVIMLTFVEKRS